MLFPISHENGLNYFKMIYSFKGVRPIQCSEFNEISQIFLSFLKNQNIIDDMLKKIFLCIFFFFFLI